MNDFSACRFLKKRRALSFEREAVRPLLLRILILSVSVSTSIHLCNFYSSVADPGFLKGGWLYDVTD